MSKGKLTEAQVLGFELSKEISEKAYQASLSQKLPAGFYLETLRTTFIAVAARLGGTLTKKQIFAMLEGSYFLIDEEIKDSKKKNTNTH